MGQQSITILTLTVLAAAAISARQLVSPTGGVATAGGPILGAAETDAANGEYFAVNVLGSSPVIADGAITKGMELEVGTAGAAAEAATGRVIGIALEDAADGAVFEALLIPAGIHPPAAP